MGGECSHHCATLAPLQWIQITSFTGLYFIKKPRAGNSSLTMVSWFLTANHVWPCSAMVWLWCVTVVCYQLSTMVHYQPWLQNKLLPFLKSVTANNKLVNVYVINFKCTIKFLLCFIFLEANIEVTQDQEKPCSTISNPWSDSIIEISCCWVFHKLFRRQAKKECICITLKHFFFKEYIEVSQDHVIPLSTIFNADLVLVYVFRLNLMSLSRTDQNHSMSL